MANSKMPIQSATIQVDGGEAVQVYDGNGFIAGMDEHMTIPEGGTFTMTVQTDDVYPFETQTLGGGCPEWIVLQDATEAGTAPRLKVTGTAPDGVTGGVTFVINGVLDGVTYTFPTEDEPVSIAVETPAPSIVWEYEDGGSVGAGFFNLRRLIMKADTIEYTPGGIDVSSLITPKAVVGVSAKGGYMAKLDKSTGKVRLYTANSTEASGTVEDLTLVVLGRQE